MVEVFLANRSAPNRLRHGRQSDRRAREQRAFAQHFEIEYPRRDGRRAIPAGRSVGDHCDHEAMKKLTCTILVGFTAITLAHGAEAPDAGGTEGKDAPVSATP